MLKQIIISALWIASLALIPFGVQAQYDDLYYNPNDYSETTSTSSYVNSSQDLSFGDSQYDDQSYEHFDDYDFYYSSRIRRFHRPVRSLDFYDPYFVDLAYYGYARPGVTIYVTSYPYRARGYHHYHHYDPFYNPYYSWHRPYRPYRPFGYGSYSYGYGYGYSSWGGYGYSPCPVFYSSSHYYSNNYYNYNNNNSSSQPNDVSSRGAHYGPRSTAGGTTGRTGRAVNSDEGVTAPNPSEERTALGNNRDNTAENRTGNQLSGEIQRPTRTQGEPASTPTQRRGDRTTEVANATFSPRERASRQAQNQFSDNRVTRDQAHADIRTNVPQTRSVERRGTDSGVRGNRGINTNQPQPRTRGTNQRGSIRNDPPQNNRSNNSSRINRGSSNNNQGSFSTPRSNNRSSRSSGVTPSRSSGNNSSSGVSPSRNNTNTRSSSSGNTRSSKSGRGG